MPSDITIVHIDDEYEELVLTWPRQFCRLVCEYMRLNGSATSVVRPTPIVLEGLDTDRTLARQFESPSGSGQIFRYIFIGDVEVPAQIQPYLGDLTLYVVDALRNDPQTQLGRTTATETIRSLNEFQPNEDSIIVFTALQGEDLNEIEKSNPGVRIISKLRDDELNDEFMRIISEGVEND